MGITFKVIGDREVALYLNRTANNIKPSIMRGLTEIGNHLEKEVKAKFGKYQAGWPKLRRASVIAKYKRRTLSGASSSKGVSLGADDPLVLFGNLKDSIEKDVKKGQMEVEIYSDNIYAAVHEYGYKHVPARSYMRLTLSQETDKIIDIMESKLDKIL